MSTKKRIKNLRPTFVSLVERGANLVPPGLMKSEDDGVEIRALTKAETSKGLLHCLVYVPDMEDAHGHYMLAEDIEEACHAHAREGLALDMRHDCNPLTKEQAHVVENLILQEQDDRFPTVDHRGRNIEHRGAWAQIVKIEDPALLAKAEAGELAEVSLYAPAGNFELVDEPPVISKTDSFSMENTELLAGLSALIEKQTESLAKAFAESHADLAKSFAKSVDDGEGAGDDAGELRKGISVDETTGEPVFDGDATSKVDLVKFRRRHEDWRLDSVMKTLSGEELIKFIESREAIADKRAAQDLELGLVSRGPSTAESILKAYGLDNNDAIVNADTAGDSAPTSSAQEVDDLIKGINADQSEVI